MLFQIQGTISSELCQNCRNFWSKTISQKLVDLINCSEYSITPHPPTHPSFLIPMWAYGPIWGFLPGLRYFKLTEIVQWTWLMCTGLIKVMLVMSLPCQQHTVHTFYFPNHKSIRRLEKKNALVSPTRCGFIWLQVQSREGLKLCTTLDWEGEQGGTPIHIYKLYG